MIWDVCVIGSGIAGLNFALRAAERNRVLIVTKKKAAEASTNFAQGGIAAVLEKTDDFRRHVQDTLIAGCFHNNKKAVEYMVRHGPDAIRRLIELGVPFASDHGKILLTREGGHSARRIAFVGDYTGKEIEEALLQKVEKHPNITLSENTFAIDLLVRRKQCFGVQISRHGKRKNIFSRVVVLATGGIGQLYEHTTNPNISTGDGLAMAYRAGCQFRDLEFIQFHPTALDLPEKPSLLISEAVRGEGAYLRNNIGERFMKTLHPQAELAPRDIVARAIFEERKKGKVFLDLRHLDQNFVKTRFPQIYQILKGFKIDMTKDLIPISPAAHYICGGIRVDFRGRTNIKNLFAFGEVAGTGVHGANRLASNSLLEALVFSDRILGLLPHSQKEGGRNFPSSPFPKTQKLSSTQKREILTLRTKLKILMWEYVGIIRTKEGLEKAIGELNVLLKKPEKIPGFSLEKQELHNMLQVSLLISKAAIKRKKSLGCHFRLPMPSRSRTF